MGILKTLDRLKLFVVAEQPKFNYVVSLTHRTTTSECPQNIRQEVFYWLDTQLFGPYRINFNGEPESISFESEDDAAHYRLTWQ